MTNSVCFNRLACVCAAFSMASAGAAQAADLISFGYVNLGGDFDATSGPPRVGRVARGDLQRTSVRRQKFHSRDGAQTQSATASEVAGATAEGR